MPADALEILTVADAKRELRLPAAYTEQDATVERCIRAAVDEVTRRTGFPLVRDYRIVLAQTDPDMGELRPLDLGTIPHLTMVSRVRHWGAAPDRSGEPGVVMAFDSWGSLRRQYATRDDWNLWPGREGWPESTDRMFEVQVLRDQSTPQGLVQAVLVAVSANYHGMRSPSQMRTIGDLCDQYLAQA